MVSSVQWAENVYELMTYLRHSDRESCREDDEGKTAKQHDGCLKIDVYY
jgi:hypothetical protein